MSMTLRELLATRSSDIVGRFTTGLKALAPEGSQLSQSLLVDHIPVFLEEITGQLGKPQRTSSDAYDTSATAPAHAEQRWKLGFDLTTLVREYGVLRHAIMESAAAGGVQLSNEEFDMLGKCLNVGVAEAVMEYTRHRDAESSLQRENLEFLAHAGELLSSSLDYRATLTRLTRLLVPRLADGCAVQLSDVSVEDMPIAHVDSDKLELLRELYRRYPLGREPVGAAAPPNRTELVRRVDSRRLEEVAENAEHLALLRRIDVTSYLVVPLRVQEHVFGALTLIHGSSGRQYSQSDVMLVTELARRAAIAIDNARLYQLSQQERSRVEAATRAKDEFVAMVSHELRTPLNAILGWVRLLQSGSLDAAKHAHALDVIERNANAQNQLVSDLLDISRAITGKMRIHPSQVDLSNIIDLALEDARLALEAKRIQVNVELDRTRSMLRADGDRLQQVVWKLLTNAIKFTPKGGTISISLSRVESDLELVIEDTGIGIPAGFLPHVFESFRQSSSSESRAYGGLGVGLSITKHLVALHGGSIEAKSDGPGKGSVFVVRLPVSPLISSTFGVPQVPATRGAPPPAALPMGPEGLRVLVVDDEPDARELVGYVLETCGMEVRLAGTAARALEELADYTPDIIISDIGMPEEDGYSLIRSIRTLSAPDKKDIPAIALTAFTRNEDRTRALVAGFNLHLAKPVEPSTLVSAVLELAGRVQSEHPPAVQ